MSEKAELTEAEAGAFISRMQSRAIAAYHYSDRNFKLRRPGNSLIILTDDLPGEGERAFFHLVVGLTMGYGPTKGEIVAVSTIPIPFRITDDVFRTEIFPYMSPGDLQGRYLICDPEAKNQVASEYPLNQVGPNHYVIPAGQRYFTNELSRRSNPSILERTTRYPFNIYATEE